MAALQEPFGKEVGVECQEQSGRRAGKEKGAEKQRWPKPQLRP